MKLLKRLSTVFCALAICMFILPSASADEWNKKTKMTFSGPFEVPGVGAQVLPAGTYIFKLVDSQSDRHIVRITNEAEDHVFTTILAIPNYRLKATSKTVLTFRERPEGQPEAIKAWFYPGNQWGQEFVYPKARAVELAKVVNEPVLAMPIEVEPTIETLRTVPIEAIQPTGESVAMTEVVEAPPAQEFAPEAVPADALPQTAGSLPLIALIGLLSLTTGATLLVVSKHSA